MFCNEYLLYQYGHYDVQLNNTEYVIFVCDFDFYARIGIENLKLGQIFFYRILHLVST